jgi:hypothetical protein
MALVVTLVTPGYFNGSCGYFNGSTVTFWYSLTPEIQEWNRLADKIFAKYRSYYPAFTPLLPYSLSFLEPSKPTPPKAHPLIGKKKLA